MKGQTMCNAELIHAAQVLNNVTEECHTYGKWKSMGYQVKRGSKALFKAAIWKHTNKRNAETGDEESRMFMKTASFFGRSQVEKIK